MSTHDEIGRLVHVATRRFRGGDLVMDTATLHARCPWNKGLLASQKQSGLCSLRLPNKRRARSCRSSQSCEGAAAAYITEPQRPLRAERPLPLSAVSGYRSQSPKRWRSARQIVHHTRRYRDLRLTVYKGLSLRLNRPMRTRANMTVNNNDPSGVVDGVCAV